MFEKVSRSLKYDSNFFFDHRHIYIYIYMDTTVDHFTPLALRVRGKNLQDLEVLSNMILHDCHNKVSSVFGTKTLPYPG